MHDRFQLILCATALTVAAAGAQSTISPAGRDRYEGSTSTPYPLGRFNGRFQQIHADLGTNPRSIVGHAYRADAVALRGTVASFDTDLEVVLAFAATPPDQASTNFAANLGSGAVTVLPLTRVNFPTTVRPGTDPAPNFDFRIPYARPFAFPGGNTPLLVDLTVHGNATARGNDLNFLPYLDAHDSPTNGRSEQPGYRFGTGCVAPGANTPSSARFTVTRFLDGSLDLDIDARDGVPSLASGTASSALVVGLGMVGSPWPWNPACTLYPSLDIAVTLPGANDGSGDWNGQLQLPAALPDGQRFYLQIVSGRPGGPGGELTFSDGSVVTVPPLGTPILPAARIANGSDRNAPTGTFARTVTVTEFF